MPMSQHPGAFKLDNAAGTLTNITTDVLSFSVTPKKNSGIHHTIGSLFQFATEGGIGYAIQVALRRQTGTGNGHEILNAWHIAGSGERTWESYQPNELTGAEKFTGECILAQGSNAQQTQGGSGEVAQLQYTLESTGTVVRSIVV